MLALACAALPAIADAPKDPSRFALKVALYPWIGDAQSWADYVEARFEAANPDIDLIVLPMTESLGLDVAYDVAHTAAALDDPQSPGHQHLVEIDTLILGALRATGAIQPFHLERPDTYRFADEAVRIEDETFGVPHWTCGYFVMSRHASLAKAKSAADLAGRLKALASPYPDLGGNIQGRWESPIIFVDAFLDTHPMAVAADAVGATRIDGRVSRALAAIGGACTSSGVNLCDREDESMDKAFARAELDALVAYSDALYLVFGQPNPALSPRDIHLAPAPFGDGDQPIFFTDALVLSRHCADASCRDAARRFAEFYTDTAQFLVAMKALDVPEPDRRSFRYVLPSRRAAMAAPEIAGDPIYRQIAPTLERARPFPNQGIPELKAAGTIGSAVDRLIGPSR